MTRILNLPHNLKRITNFVRSWSICKRNYSEFRASLTQCRLLCRKNVLSKLKPRILACALGSMAVLSLISMWSRSISMKSSSKSSSMLTTSVAAMFAAKTLKHWNSKLVSKPSRNISCLILMWVQPNLRRLLPTKNQWISHRLVNRGPLSLISSRLSTKLRYKSSKLNLMKLRRILK